MKLQEIFSHAKLSINPFKIAFQLLFQPQELEEYFRQYPTVRKRIVWEHVVLVLILLRAIIQKQYP